MVTNNAINLQPTNHCVQVGNASGGLTSVTNGTTGQFLGANTGADPTWQTPAGSSFTPYQKEYLTYTFFGGF